MTNDQQIKSINSALESYARAKHLLDRANGLWNLYERASNDRFGPQEEARIIYEQYQELVGPTTRARTKEERFYSHDWEFTKNRKVRADQVGIRVHCMVEWGTGIMTNPLLLLNVEVAEDSLAKFPTKQVQYEGAKRHVSIAHG